jgi:hypothetical protein
MEVGPRRRTTFSPDEHSTAFKVEILAVLSCALERANLYFSDPPGSIANASGTKHSVGWPGVVGRPCPFGKP